MFSELGNLLSYGAGALGIVGIVYFIIRFFINKDDRVSDIIDNTKKEKEQKVKDKQKEVDDLKKKSDELEKKQKELKDKIDKTVEEYKKEEKEIDSSESIEGTVNIIEEEW